MKIYVMMLFILINNIAYCMENLPSGCVQLSVQEDTLTLKASKPTVFLLYNQSKSDLWLTHPETNKPMSAGWSSHLSAGKWSAMFSDKPVMELSCIDSKPGHEQQIPCADMIIACSWSKVVSPADNQSAFWITENSTLKALRVYLGNHGYQLS